ncbi:hypothetical protein DL98DRAFT_233190 [Cadophora sp. DSE1049]|nr:hypothetical protein DL98DRAFT_233190 [Cadophora sp. DSE1049]
MICPKLDSLDLNYGRKAPCCRDIRGKSCDHVFASAPQTSLASGVENPFKNLLSPFPSRPVHISKLPSPLAPRLAPHRTTGLPTNALIFAPKTSIGSAQHYCRHLPNSPNHRQGSHPTLLGIADSNNSPLVRGSYSDARNLISDKQNSAPRMAKIYLSAVKSLFGCLPCLS